MARRRGKASRGRKFRSAIKSPIGSDVRRVGRKGRKRG